MATKAENPSLLEALVNAGQPDLVASEAKIAELEKELTTLRMVRRVLRAKLGLSKKPGGNRRKAVEQNGDGREDEDDDDDDELPEDEKPFLEKIDNRRKILNFIRNGRKSPQEIVAGCGLSIHGLTKILDHEWFAKNADGSWRVTSDGMAALNS